MEEAKSETKSEAKSGVKSESRLKITILADNHTLTDHYFLGEPGLSILLQEGDRKVLFDAGYSGVFMENAARMQISLLDLDFLVLSHGHLDHTWGLAPLVSYYTRSRLEGLPVSSPVLVAHPQAFACRVSRVLPNNGSLLGEGELSRFFEMKLTRGPFWISERLVFLGEVPRENSFEARVSRRIMIQGGQPVTDHLWDDSALVYNSPEGLVIITGCSHSGVCNIIEYARVVCGQEKIRDVLGGFHLLQPSREQLQGTLAYFKETGPREVHACHCTDLASLVALSRVANIQETGAGLVLHYR